MTILLRSTPHSSIVCLYARSLSFSCYISKGKPGIVTTIHDLRQTFDNFFRLDFGYQKLKGIM